MPRSFARFLSLAIVTGLLTSVLACGGKQPPTPPPPPPPAAPAPVAEKPPPPPPAPPPKPTPAPVPPPTPSAIDIFNKKTLKQLNDERPLADVYFEYDKAELSEQARASLEKNASWMRQWPSTMVNVEGHADARGTNEYNLALGERRASAVRDYMVSLGVPATRINIISLGEEQPACREEAESCYHQNRRGHFVITAK